MRLYSASAFAPVLAACCLIASGAARAVEPVVGQIFPPGGQRGTEAAVTLYGARIGDAEAIVFHDAGVTCTAIEVVNDNAVTATLAIAADAPLGRQALRLRTASGISNLFQFHVGALPERVEAEDNGTFETAQEIPYNSTVNGTITPEDVDYFAVHLEEGQHLAVETEALRLGIVLFDPKIRLFGPEEHERFAADDVALTRQDAAFTYTAIETGLHRIAVSEASFGGGGNYHYRLHIGSFPRPLAALPLGGQAGAEVAVTWLGDASIAAQTVALPADAAGETHVFPASEAGVAPTPQPFRASPFASVSEAGPTTGFDDATPGTVPGGFDGVIGAPGELDWYSFEGKKDMTLEFRAWARALGSPLDSVMHLWGPERNYIVGDDDARGSDSFFQATLPADGTYWLRIEDHLKRGGPEFAYRIEAAPPAPAISVSAAANVTAKLAIPQGNRALLVLQAARQNVGGPVDVAFSSLPEGVTVEGGPIEEGDARAAYILSASPEAPKASALIHTEAAIGPEGGRITGAFEQSITLVEGQNQTIFHTHTPDRLAVAVTDPAPFSLEVVPPQSPLTPATGKLLRVKATRAEGFTAPINLRFLYLPPGMNGGTAQIPEGQSEADIRIEGSNAFEGVQQVVVEAESGLWRVCSAFVPIERTPPWVAFQMPEVSLEQGETVEIRAAVTHHRDYEGEHRVSLINIPNGLSAEPQPFAHGTEEVVFTLTAAPDAPVGKFENAAMLAPIQLGGESFDNYSGGGLIQVFEPLPAELQAAEEVAPATAADEAQDAQPERKTRFPNG